jgi:hypothetical protein
VDPLVLSVTAAEENISAGFNYQDDATDEGRTKPALSFVATSTGTAAVWSSNDDVGFGGTVSAEPSSSSTDWDCGCPENEPCVLSIISIFSVAQFTTYHPNHCHHFPRPPPVFLPMN